MGDATSRQQQKRMKVENLNLGKTPFAKSEPAPVPGYQYQYLDDAGATVLKEDTEIVYHGTQPMLVPQILAEGLRPSLGAGSDGLHAHYGIITPGVYTSPRLHGIAHRATP